MTLKHIKVIPYLSKLFIDIVDCLVNCFSSNIIINIFLEVKVGAKIQ